MESTQLPDESQIQAEIKAGVAKSWKGLLVAGILALLVGVFAIFFPVAASVTTSIFIGWIFILGGVFQIAAAFTVHSAWRLLGRIIIGIISIWAGIYLLTAPLEGTVTLTFVLAAFFFAGGFVNLVAAIAGRGNDGAGLVALNGVISIIIAILIIAELPSSASWAIGLLVGIYFVFEGMTLIVLASTGKRIAKTA